MLVQLKNIDMARYSLDELVSLSAYAKGLSTEFQANGIDCPEWLQLRQKELVREIRTRNADELERQLRAARNRMESLKTPEEKREAARAEIDRLEKMLAND